MNIDLHTILPVLFSDVGFLNDHADQFALYVDLRVKGYHGHDAMSAAFGPANGDNNARLRCTFLESTEQYRSMFDKRLKEIPVSEILDERTALREYMSMYRNPFLKGSERNAALKEACVIAGITSIDDAGRSRKVPTLADLYAEPKPEGEKPAPLH